MKLVVIESPLRGNYERNRAYAKRCVLDSLKRGEAPYASHLLFAQPGILDDTNQEQRDLGIKAGLAWGEAADYVAVYIDRGISKGMEIGIQRHLQNNIEVEYRSLDNFDDYDLNAECMCETPGTVLAECPKCMAELRAKGGGPGCPDAGRCHGSMEYCDICGDVRQVCHDKPNCDIHRMCPTCGMRERLCLCRNRYAF